VTGNPEIGATLTAIVNVTDANGVKVDSEGWVWERSADGVTWTTINGETGDTYTLTQADVDTFVRPVYSYENLGGQEISVTANSPIRVQYQDVGAGGGTPPPAPSGTLEGDATLTQEGADIDIEYRWTSDNGTPEQVTLQITLAGTDRETQHSIQMAAGVAVLSASSANWDAATGIWTAPTNANAQTLTFILEADAFSNGDVKAYSQVSHDGEDFDAGEDGTIEAVFGGDFITITEIEGGDGGQIIVDLPADTPFDFAGGDFTVEIDDLDGDFINFGIGDELIFTGGEHASAMSAVLDDAGHITFSDLENELVVNVEASDIERQAMIVETPDGLKLSYHQVMPNLASTVAVDESLINGITNRDFITGTDGIRFEVELRDLGYAGYNNVVGVYEVGANGSIQDIQILFANANQGAGTSVALNTVEEGHELGFFIVQNGAWEMTDVTNADSFKFVTQNGVTGSATGNETLYLSVNGEMIDANVLHSFDKDLNIDNQVHVLSGAEDNGRVMTIGFEDLTGLGDSDFEDVGLTISRIDDLG